MKILCIVAEYNPLHNGHLYHLQRSRALADYCIVLMGGDFCQRGLSAVLDQYTRARHAILAGADLVVAMPTLTTVHCAEQFAWGAMNMLNAIPADKALSFGSECGDVHLLMRTAALLSHPDVQADTRSLVKAGTSYPAARQQALEAYAAQHNISVADIASPNNILGLEYLNKANPDVEMHTILRSDDYHSTTPAASSSFIRRCLADGQDFSSWTPDYVAADLANATREQDVLYLAALRAHDKEHYADLMDDAEGLHNRIWQCASDANTLSEAIDAATTKRYTRARITRLFTSALLGLRQQDLDELHQQPPYYHVLAMREGRNHLLSLLDKAGAVTTTMHQLEAGTRSQQLDAKAHATYRLLHAVDVAQTMQIIR